MKILTIPIGDILVSREAMWGAFNNVDSGRVSKTESDILEVWKIEDERLLLVDGLHRFVELLLKGVKQVKVDIVGEGYSDYWATPYPGKEFEVNSSLKYGGLEDLADEEILDDLYNKLYGNGFLSESYKRRLMELGGI